MGTLHHGHMVAAHYHCELGRVKDQCSFQDDVVETGSFLNNFWEVTLSIASPLGHYIQGGGKVLHSGSIVQYKRRTPPECNTLVLSFLTFETPFRWPPAQISQPILFKIVTNKNQSENMSNK